MTPDELRTAAFSVNEWCRSYGIDTPNFGLCLAIGAASEQLIVAAAEVVERMDALLRTIDGEGE